LAITVGIIHGIGIDTDSSNNWSLSVVVAFATACWVILAIPWFFLEQSRPGQKVPAGMNIVSVGLRQLVYAVREIFKLRQTFIYLVGYFLLGDSLNTMVTVFATLQNEIVSYDTLTLLYLLIVGIATQAAGIGLFWLAQKRYRIGTKPMLLFVGFWICVLSGWGLIGIWTTRFGFHNVWEVWLYQAYYGLVVCPWYAYSQTMISEVCPRGKEFLFFSLFSIIGKTSSFVGPFVSSAIIDASGNNNMPFAFLFALSIVSCGIVACVSPRKSRIECFEYIEREKAKLEKSTRDV
jgi:MFS-type transporter involved in bile tolerance (Atg22 family)